MRFREIGPVALFGVLMLAGIAYGPAASAAGDTKPKVMILGTFHFEGSTEDAISVTMGDLTSPARQAEIKEVVERLAKFAPTTIMVELTPEEESDFNATYQAYRKGEHQLTANERQQIAMRLAAKLGHAKIHAVDHKQDMDFGRMMAAGQAAGQGEALAAFQTLMADVEKKVQEVQGPDSSVLDALLFHNSDWAHAGNSLYLQLALLGTTEDPAGAEVVGGWYERNLKIYANIARAIEGPEERVLVIFGTGHLAQLASFFDQNPDYEWVSALEVLGR